MIKIIGPLIYIALSIMGVLIKNATEENKRKKQRTKVGVTKKAYQERMSDAEIELAIIEHFQDSVEPSQSSEQTVAFSVETEAVDEVETERFNEEETPNFKPTPPSVQGGNRLRPSLAQAVIMSEIIRPPRSKRPWPSR